MSKIGLVIGREYTSRVKKRSFLILTILIPVLMGGLGYLAMWLGQEEEKHYKVLVSDPRRLCDAKIYQGQDDNPPASFYFTEDLVTDTMFMEMDIYQSYDVLVALDPDVITNKTINAASRDDVSPNAERYIGKRLEERLEEYFALDQGIPLEKYRKINQSYRFKVYDLGEDPRAPQCEAQDIAQGVGLGFSVMIYVFLMVYGGMVMRGVMEEKQGRVVEIIVSSVKPFDLMLGKIIGIGLVGLTQFLIWFVLISGIMMFIQPLFMSGMDAGQMQMMQSEELAQMQQMNCFYEAIYEYINWPVLLIMFVIYFLGGYLLYGGLFAVVGAAADSESDTQQLMIPIMIPLTFVYILSFSMIGEPDGAAALWGSHVPFSSPIIMLQRIAAGTVSIWEVIISLLLLVGTFILTTLFAGKVYRTGILMYGKKASWKEIIKWLRH